MDNEKTLVLIKPDGVKRGIVGEIITRFERAGMKIVGMKLVWADKDTALKHYTEDITIRRGEKVRTLLVDFIQSGPVVALCLSGVDIVHNVRKMVGETEPKTAAPGTIRGDYAHISFARANEASKAVENIIHASATPQEAAVEVSIWFSDSELFAYKTVHEVHTF